MARLSFENAARALDVNGDPVPGAKRYTYLAGSTTLADTFTDVALTTAQANPLTADASGYFPAVYVTEGGYKVRVTDAADNLLYEADNIVQGEDRELMPIMLAAAGQSNIASSNAQAAGGDLTSDPRILFWNGAAWAEWTPSTGMGVGAAGRNSILFQAAKRAIADGYPKVYCVVDAHAGQPISYWTGSGTSSLGYASLKAQMDGAIASAEAVADGITGVSSFIWGQGESDGGAGFVASAYKSSFGTLKAQLRAESWFDQYTPIVCLEMPSLGSAMLVNRFFLGELPFDADPYTCVARTKSLDDGADNLHWTGAAMNEIGYRCYEMVKKRVYEALPYPHRIDADAFHLRLEQIFGKGLAARYSAGGDQVIFGATSDAVFPSTSAPTVTFDLNDAYFRVDAYGFAASTFEFLGGAILKSYTAANFSDISHAVNTNPDKKEGMVHWDAANNRLAVATGSADGDAWVGFSGDTTYTPA